MDLGTHCESVMGKQSMGGKKIRAQKTQARLHYSVTLTQLRTIGSQMMV